jgi:competence protein ComFC
LSRKLDLLIKTNPILQDDIKKWSKCILTFVPSHRTRKYFIKWYNQSELLAQELSKISTYEVVPITKKIKYTTSQAKLNRAKRIINLIWAFKINSQYQLHGDETIIIVDDVTTTWSTLQEIAKNITNIYPHTKIWWCVIARNMN